MSEALKNKTDKSLSSFIRKQRDKKKTLNISQPAQELLLVYWEEYIAELLNEADQYARSRRGDDIQSGDVEAAKRHIEGKAKGRFWNVVVGSIFLGAGVQGLIDAILGSKGLPFYISYVASIVLGVLLIAFGAPRR